MKLGEFVRSAGFWALDAVMRWGVRKRIQKLSEIEARNNGNSEALEFLLKHAIATVPYYKNISVAALNEFPVVSKKDYLANYSAFRSSDYLNDDELHKVYTSGSTGTPFMAYQDKDKVRWHQAGLIKLNRSIGWSLGARFLFFRVFGVTHTSDRLSLLMTNTIPVDVVGFDDDAKERIHQRLLKDKSLHLMLGYASAIESLAEYLENFENEDYGINLVISDSETLTSVAKEKIEKIFKCPVLNRYGNNENGIFALTRTNDDRMTVNFAEFYVELLSLDSDEPAVLGEIGRIVITDLYNKAFPFIRYDTGDLGIAEKMLGNQCLVLKELVGRISSSLRTSDGQLIGETTVTAFFEDIVGLKRYQVAQTGEKQYEIRLENEETVFDSLLEQRALKVFGKNSEVTIKHVKLIPQGKNGKYKITSYEVD